MKLLVALLGEQSPLVEACCSPAKPPNDILSQQKHFAVGITLSVLPAAVSAEGCDCSTLLAKAPVPADLLAQPKFYWLRHLNPGSLCVLVQVFLTPYHSQFKVLSPDCLASCCVMPERHGLLFFCCRTVMRGFSTSTSCART